MKKTLLLIAFCVTSTFLFAQTVLDNIETKLDDGTWGEVLPRGSVNLPASGSYPSSNINGFTLTNAVMYGSNVPCPKGGKHTVSIALDRKRGTAFLEFPPVKEIAELEIHASTGSEGASFAVEEKVKNSWKEVGLYTTQKKDSIYLIPIERNKETTLRIRNAAASGLFIYQITTRTLADKQRVNILEATPGEGSLLPANLTKSGSITFDKKIKKGTSQILLNNQPLEVKIDGNMATFSLSLDAGTDYTLLIPASTFTDEKGKNGNIEKAIKFKTFRAVSTPKGFTSHLDVVYNKVGDWDGRMDLYLPPKGEQPTPIIINMHGGGWNHGEKEQITGFGSVLKNGYAVANVEYRMTPQATAPAAVEDVRCAMLYIVNNAKELNVDVHKIIFMGTSAGAHLALTAAYLQSNSTYDNSCNKGVPFKVAAVVDRYGPTDLANFFSYKSVGAWLGGENVEFAKKMSPLHYVTAQTPPTIIIHGNADAVVPYSQSKVLYEALVSAGVYNEFITVEGGGHGGFSNEKKNEIEDAVIKFLDKVLNK